jgi:hypothetical protein
MISGTEGIEDVAVYGVEIPGCDGKAGMAAIKLDPSNEKLQADYKQISALVSRQKEAVSTSSEAAGEAISG